MNMRREVEVAIKNLTSLNFRQYLGNGGRQRHSCKQEFVCGLSNGTIANAHE